MAVTEVVPTASSPQRSDGFNEGPQHRNRSRCHQVNQHHTSGDTRGHQQRIQVNTQRAMGRLDFWRSLIHEYRQNEKSNICRRVPVGPHCLETGAHLKHPVRLEDTELLTPELEALFNSDTEDKEFDGFADDS